MLLTLNFDSTVWFFSKMKIGRNGKKSRLTMPKICVALIKEKENSLTAKSNTLSYSNQLVNASSKLLNIPARLNTLTGETEQGDRVNCTLTNLRINGCLFVNDFVVSVDLSIYNFLQNAKGSSPPLCFNNT